MQRKLSEKMVFDLTWLTIEELNNILVQLKDDHKEDNRFDLINYISRYYEDKDISPFIMLETPLKPKISVEKQLEDIRNCYKSTNTKVDKIVRKRGRKRIEGNTLKDKIYILLNTNYEKQNQELSYNEVLESGILNIAENTYKTLLSQWRKSKGIKVKRGRKGGNKNEK